MIDPDEKPHVAERYRAKPGEVIVEYNDNRRKADQKAARDLADSCHSSHQATTVTLTQTVERTNEALDRNTAAHSQCGEVLRDVRGELRSRPSP